MASVTMPRRNEGLLQPLERPALRWLAVRMPEYVTPDMLTTVGFVGAILTGIGFAFAEARPLMLLVAAVGLVVNWFGDSLDGTLARYRNIERPTYGFFVDHTTDVFEQVIMAVGIGLSGYIRFDLAIIGLIVYLLLSVLTFVRAHFLKVLQISYSGFGPTEIRFTIAMLCITILLFPPGPFSLFGWTTTYPNCGAMLWIVSGFSVLVWQTWDTLACLKAQECEELSNQQDKVAHDRN